MHCMQRGSDIHSDGDAVCLTADTVCRVGQTSQLLMARSALTSLSRAMWSANGQTKMTRYHKHHSTHHIEYR